MAVPINPFELVHFNMLRAHETFTIGYNTIFTKLDNPPLNDLGNFLGYCEAWVKSVIHHHDTEEETVFPVLNKKMDFSHEQEQHTAIHYFLDNFAAVIRDARVDNSKFDAAKLKVMMQDSKDILFKHLEDELIHIEASKLRKAELSEDEIREMLKAMESHAKNHGDPFLIVPFMRSHTPPEYKESWPAMPWILRKLVIPYLLAKRHSGYWKYSPYAMS